MSQTHTDPNGTSSTWDRIRRATVLRRQPQTSTTQSTASRTAFVLGGGGAKGACQVGMLRALVEHDIQADLVVGVSVGALNGAVYAQEPSKSAVEQLANLWKTLDQNTLLPKRRFANSLRYAQRTVSVFPDLGLKRLIREHISISDIHDAQIPLHVLATKYSNGAEVWFDHGPPEDVLYASAAIPGVFPPFPFHNELLIDGGVADDTPISKAVDLGADHIILLLCGTTYAKLSPPQRPLEALMRSASHAKASRLRSEIAHLQPSTKLTILDCPEAAGVEALDFSKRELLLEAGYERAKGLLDGTLVVDYLKEPSDR